MSSRRERREKRRKRKGEVGLGTYLKEAFTWRWNLLAFPAAAIGSLLLPAGYADPAFTMVIAAELVYLAGLVSIPRFRTAIDAKYAANNFDKRQEKRKSRNTLSAMLNGLHPDSRRRFVTLRTRILEMKRLAKRVQGRHERDIDELAGDDLNNPSLNRLLWVFLRLLYSQAGLRRFLSATDEDAIASRITDIRAQMEEHKDDADGRVLKSLTDSLATAELRMENYKKAEANAKYVAIELDRIENKIQALVEMSINHADPDYISSEVDSVAESIVQTESAIADMKFITGLSTALEEAPAILDDDLEAAVAG